MGQYHFDKSPFWAWWHHQSIWDLQCHHGMNMKMEMKFLQMLGWFWCWWGGSRRSEHCPGPALSINTLYQHYCNHHNDNGDDDEDDEHWSGMPYKSPLFTIIVTIMKMTVNHFSMMVSIPWPCVPCCLNLSQFWPHGKFLAVLIGVIVGHCS